MSDFDPRPALAAILGHLNLHPHLTDAVSITASDTGIRVHIWTNRAHLGPLADWTRSLTNASTVRVDCVMAETGNVHLHVTGRVIGDIPTRIVVVIDPVEAGPLAEHLPLTTGTEFDVEVLYRLVDAGQVTA